ncbi:MAG: YkvA family protein [bacterium]|nr:YkvA family protein [bacterium]
MASDDKKQGFFRELISDFGAFSSMLRDYFKKRYPATPWWTLVGIIVALVYIINPFDLVPDAIPFIGAIDDAAVAGLELALMRKDLHKYRQWRDGKNLK